MCRQLAMLAMLTESRLGLTKAIPEYWVEKTSGGSGLLNSYICSFVQQLTGA
jgi:hypothetical protein